MPLTVENTGHVIEVPVPEESAARLRVGGATYELLQPRNGRTVLRAR